MSRADLEAHAKALRAIHGITRALLDAAEEPEALGRSLEAVARFTHFPAVACFRLDEKKQRLELLAARGFAAETVRASRVLPVVGSLTGIAVQSRMLVTSDDVSRDPRTAPHVARLLAAEGFTGIASVPLLVQGRTIGAMNLIYKGVLGLSPIERQLIATIADVVAIEIERADSVSRLRDAVTVRDGFLQVASHELRSPVTALLLTIQWLQRRYPADAVLSQGLGIAVAQIHRLQMLIETLLDATQLAAGGLELHRESTDLAHVAGAVVRQLEEGARRAGCRLDLQSASVRGHWDPAKLHRALAHVVANAVKFGEGKPVEIRVEPRDDSAVVTVHDRGIGVAQEDSRRIFEAFERAVSSRHYGGLGLGLYVAFGVVEAHGGTIRVDSAPGEGSTFTITLPRHAR